jgi:hypothetical protein
MNQKEDIKSILTGGGITLTEDLQSQEVSTSLASVNAKNSKEYSQNRYRQESVYQMPIKPTIAILFVVLAVLSIAGGVMGAFYYSNIVIFISGIISACIFWGISWIIEKVNLIDNKLDLILKNNNK